MTLETNLGFDVSDLTGLDGEVRKSVIQARIETRNIRDSLDPDHVTSWASLIMILESALEKVRQKMRIYQVP